jgi:preprotein translocase subunit SecA
MGFLSRLFGRAIGGQAHGRYQPTVDRINSLESQYQKLTDAQLRDKTKSFKERIANGESLDQILPDAFAAVREAAKRTIGQRHFDVQLSGGISLHQGKIAEMKTGEGKTLAATLPIYLNALTGKGAHLVTVNDYLARRDADWMGPIYDVLGLTVGAIGHEQSYRFERGAAPESERTALGIENLVKCTRKEAYAADITYGTNNEFGFDYLRDNMAMDAGQMVQRGHNYAIIDEVDSILIDEARTPLIISAPAEESTALYKQFAGLVPRLKKEEDYKVDEKLRAVTLSDAGVKKMEGWINVPNLYDPSHVHLVHHLEESLKAHALFHKDKDYVVKEGEVIIVDEFTGRLMHGRRYSGGLHQAIEAKEGVEVKRESDTLATITFQNLFRMYEKLAGMTGTAKTEQDEFYKIYNLEVAEIMTNKPMIRKDDNDVVYKNLDGKFAAVVSDIKERQRKGQPVLVGTISIEKNEQLSRLLKREKIAHEVLNAKHHEKEAKAIANAGKVGAVTVATNMAGRGVDIILGGKLPEGREKSKKAMEKWQKEHDKAVSLGGLHVLGTERHESRRIDNQLRGRGGRQGDPGSSQFYVSLDDDLMRIFGGERLKGMMTRLGLPDDQPIQAGLVSRSIEQAQKKVEAHNFDLRKHLLEYDDVMNKHRTAIYQRRREILEKDDVHDQILGLMNDAEKKDYAKKEKEIGKEQIKRVEKFVYLRIIDTLWVEHLNTMEELREGIGLRGYGQRDPLVEYKHEAYNLYQALQGAIEDRVVDTLLKLETKAAPVPGPALLERPIEERGADESLAGGGIHVAEEPVEAPAQPSEKPEPTPPVPSGVSVVVRKAGETKEEQPQAAPEPAPVEHSHSYSVPKVGRNEPCPCGVVDPKTGKTRKYKKCFLAGNPECGFIKSGAKPPA